MQNPVRNYLQFTNEQEGAVSIYTLTGKLVKQFPNSAYTGLDVSDLNNGLYLLKVNGVGVTKFIKY